MDNERTSVVIIDGKEYELVLTTRATREIAKKYGGLSNLGESLMKSENADDALSEVVWLITLLANQSIMIKNLKNPQEKLPLLTEEEVELLTSPCELGGYKDAISTAIYLGTKRNVLGEEKNPKNSQVG